MFWKRMQGLKWVRNNHKTDWPIMCIISICLYLVFMAESKSIWFYFIIILLVGLLNNPKLIITSIFIFIIASFSHAFRFERYIEAAVEGEYKIIETTSIGPIINVNGSRVLIKSFENFSKGEWISVIGKTYPPVNSDTFNMISYAKSLNIANIVNYPIVEKTKESTYFISKFIQSLSIKDSNYAKVIPLLLLGQKTGSSKELYDVAINLNVVHLFVISGFHIALLFKVFKKVFGKWVQNEYVLEAIGFIPVFFYLLLLDFSLSATRATLLILFGIINTHFLKQRFTSLERLSIVTILIFFVQPWKVFSFSFIYSFIATFFIMYCNTIKFKKQEYKWLAIMLFAYFSTLPVSIFLNKRFSVFGFIFSIGLSPLFAIYYIISIIIFPLGDIIDFIYQPFISIILNTNSINVMLEVKNLSLINLQTIYLTITCCFIINKIWNMYMVKSII